MIPFTRYSWLFFGLSLLVIVPGLISLTRFGLRPALDFTGGSALELRVASGSAQLDTEKIKSVASQTYEVSEIKTTGERQFKLIGKTITNDQKNEVESHLMRELGTMKEISFETVGPVLGQELVAKTIFALSLAAIFILLYVAHQFSELKYGACAIFAMVHDLLVILGSFSLFGHFWHVEVDVLFVTALLTALSFSVHDTIVVYDRIRELRRRQPRLPLNEILDAAILETLGRSLNNFVAIGIMLLALVLVGGTTIHWFAVALLIGALTGTYSSPFTAVPLLLVWEKTAQWRQRTIKNG